MGPSISRLLTLLLLPLAAIGAGAGGAVNVTCVVRENLRFRNTTICSLRDELLRKRMIDTDMQLRYEIVPVSNVESQDSSGLLELGASTGLISASQPLDRERTAWFDLLVLVDNAKVAGNTRPPKLPNSVVVNLRVEVADENDNAPVWSQPIAYLNFSESEARNATRFFGLATDRDLGANGKLAYRKQNTLVTFVNGTTRQLLNESDEPFRFTVVKRKASSSTGKKEIEMGALSLLRPLDAESVIEYRFDLVAIDKSGQADGSLSSTATVVVHVIDANEFAPVFVFSRQQPSSSAMSYNLNISEAHPIDTPIVTVFATDADAGASRAGSSISYSILSAGNDGSQNGDISMNSGASPSSSSGVATATTAESRFAVNENTGELFLREKLDYEALADPTKRLYVVVQAVDSGDPIRFTATTTVTVNVLDENDNAPEIRISCNDEPLVAGPLRNVLTIEENSELPSGGDTDCRISAIDADSGINGHVKCAVGKAGSHAFALIEQHANRRTPIYRLRVLQAFDYESVRQIDVPINCSDGVNRWSTSIISVLITDVNDCAPNFTQATYNAQVAENSDVNTFVQQLRAVDRDSVPPNANTQVRYEIVSQSVVDASSSASSNGVNEAGGDLKPLFAVDSHGVVRLVQPLDRERVERVVLTVRAVDGANSSLSSTAVLTVNVLDMNDNPPVSRRFHSFSVIEDVQIGTSVGSLIVTDADFAAHRFSFDVVTPDCVGVFRIAGDNRGELQTSAYLDRELRQSYMCEIDVSDGHFHTRTVANVTVVDANDHAPVFTFPSGSNSTVSIGLAAAAVGAGAVVARVSAVDADAGPNALVRFSMQHPSDLFELDDVTGELRLKRPLQISDGVRRHLLIRANDQGSPQLSSTAVLTVLLGTSQSTGQYDSGVLLESSSRTSKTVLDTLSISDGMMSVLVTVSLVAVSVCLLATVFVVLFLIWKRYGRRDSKLRRHKRKRKSADDTHAVIGKPPQHRGSGSAAAAATAAAAASLKRPVSIIDQQLFFDVPTGPITDQASTPMLSFSVTNELSPSTEDPSAERTLDTIGSITPTCPLKRPIPTQPENEVTCRTAAHVNVMDAGVFGRETAANEYQDFTNGAGSSSRPTTRHLARHSATPLPFRHGFNHSQNSQHCSLAQTLSLGNGRSVICATLPRKQTRHYSICAPETIASERNCMTVSVIDKAMANVTNACSSASASVKAKAKAKVNQSLAHENSTLLCSGTSVKSMRESNFRPSGLAQRDDEAFVCDGSDCATADRSSSLPHYSVS